MMSLSDVSRLGSLAVDDIHHSAGTDKQGQSEASSKKAGHSNVECYCGERSATRGIVMVPMKNKVLRFPKQSSSQADAPIDAPHIVFSLGDVRLALQYNL